MLRVSHINFTSKQIHDARGACNCIQLQRCLRNLDEIPARIPDNSSSAHLPGLKAPVSSFFGRLSQRIAKENVIKLE